MKLYRLSENIYYTDYEKERDRPRLGYVKGKNFSLAVDAGHSDEHVKEFYDLLRKEKLPLPNYTVVTHWHWDHTFGMHAVHGQTIASKKTNAHLTYFISKINPDFIKDFLNWDPSIALEYKDNKPVIVEKADIEFEDKMTLDLGDMTVDILEAPSPHSDDCTLIHIPGEKVLFMGDGCCGVPPTWIPDKKKAEEMIQVLKSLDFEISIGGHWENLDRKGQFDFFFEEQE